VIELGRILVPTLTPDSALAGLQLFGFVPARLSLIDLVLVQGRMIHGLGKKYGEKNLIEVGTI
jgi:hypothetical protein